MLVQKAPTKTQKKQEQTHKSLQTEILHAISDLI